MKMSPRFPSAPRALAVLAFGFFSVALTRGAMAQGYFTNFDDSAKFIQGGTVSDQDSWVSNDESTNSVYNGEAIGQSDSVNPTGTYQSSPTDINLANFGGNLNQAGGVLPGRSDVTLTHAANLGTLQTSASFQSDFVVLPSTTAHPHNDTFSFVFQNSAGTTLFGVNFAPPAAFGAIGSAANTGQDDVTVTSATGTAPSSAPGGTSLTLSFRYRLTLTITIAAGGGGTFNAALQPEAANGSLNGTSPTTIASGDTFAGTIANIGTEWKLLDTTDTATGTPNTGNSTAYTGGGYNTLLFDNFGFVPEPSEYAMFGLGAAALLVAVRRRLRAA